MSTKILNTTTYNWFKLKYDLQSHFKVFSNGARVRRTDFLVYLWHSSVPWSLKGWIFMLDTVAFTYAHNRHSLKAHCGDSSPSELPSRVFLMPCPCTAPTLPAEQAWLSHEMMPHSKPGLAEWGQGETLTQIIHHPVIFWDSLILTVKFVLIVKAALFQRCCVRFVSL